MKNYPNMIVRHRKENLKKCSLSGLEDRADLKFITYPASVLPPLDGPYVVLALDAPPLSTDDQSSGLILLDATWRYAKTMSSTLAPWLENAIPRSLPGHFRTAYPRKQTDCEDPERGLASIEALFIAYFLTGRDTTGLLDHYFWRESFVALNPSLQIKSAHK
jgi:hypothetical protein